MAAAFAPAPPLTRDDLLHLKPSLQACPERFPSCFRAATRRYPSVPMLEGLLSEERRKSIVRMVLRRLDGDRNPGPPPAVLCGG